MSFPFPFAPPRGRVSTFVPAATGSLITDFALGTTSALFDGNTSQVHNSPAPGKSSTSGYGGKTYVSAKIPDKIIVYPTSDIGFDGDGAISVTIELYGKNGTPSSATDGTLLGSTTFTNDTTTARTVTSTSGASGTAYTSIWVRFNAASATSIWCSEIEIYEWA